MHVILSMCYISTKPVFWVSDQVRLKPACSATETTYNVKGLHIESVAIILSRYRITKALTRLRGYVRNCVMGATPMVILRTEKTLFRLLLACFEKLVSLDKVLNVNRNYPLIQDKAASMGH